MKVLKVTYFDYGEPFIEEEYETEIISYDENTKCLAVNQIDNNGHAVVVSFPITNLRKFSVTELDRRLP